MNEENKQKRMCSNLKGKMKKIQQHLTFQLTISFPILFIGIILFFGIAVPTRNVSVSLATNDSEHKDDFWYYLALSDLGLNEPNGSVHLPYTLGNKNYSLVYLIFRVGKNAKVHVYVELTPNSTAPVNVTWFHDSVSVENKTTRSPEINMSSMQYFILTAGNSLNKTFTVYSDLAPNVDTGMVGTIVFELQNASNNEDAWLWYQVRILERGKYHYGYELWKFINFGTPETLLSSFMLLTIISLIVRKKDVLKR